MDKLKVLDLFSGIGGFSLGLERTNRFETVAFCEIEKFPRKILAQHWPNVPIHDDVRTLDGTQYRGTVDVVCGGFPCQDLSVAGNQEGIDAERSGLWSQLCRIVSEVRPKYAIVENVPNLLAGQRGAWFGRVLGDLAEIGYDAEWHCIPASAIGARHRRDRVWIICHPNNNGQTTEEISQSAEQGSNNSKERKEQASKLTRSGNERGNVAYAKRIRLQGSGQSEQPMYSTQIITRQTVESEHGRFKQIWASEPDVGRVVDGVPDTLDALKGLGNAVVPQIPELIGKAILDHEDQKDQR